MDYYETDDDYSWIQLTEVLEWFNRTIGTDYEVNEGGSNDCFYVVFFELTPKEVFQISKFEHHFREKEGMK